MGLGKDGVARENNGSGETWQLETEVGRTLGDVLPYKSASVWCTAINLNDLSPPRACFGIQKPQRGLLACQGCSSFGLPPSVEQRFSLEPVAEEETDCSTPITCPCPLGLILIPFPQSQHVTTLELRQKHPLGSLDANYCDAQLLRVHVQYASVVCYRQHCWALTVGCAVFLRW